MLLAGTTVMGTGMETAANHRTNTVGNHAQASALDAGTVMKQTASHYVRAPAGHAMTKVGMMKHARMHVNHQDAGDAVAYVKTNAKAAGLVRTGARRQKQLKQHALTRKTMTAMAVLMRSVCVTTAKQKK